MKRNRFVAVVLSLVLLVSLIGGCADNSTADAKSKPTSSTQSKPVSSTQSEVIGDTPDEPTSSAQSNSTGSSQSNPTSSTQSKPTNSASSKPSSNTQSNPTNSSSSKPSSSTQPLPSSNAQSNPSSNTQSKPNSSAPSPVRVSSVKISETTLSLEVGKTQQLTATVSPSNANNKSVTWTSSNSSVAQVSSTGKVTAKAKGSATITVTTVDGNIKATCKVTVTEAPSASEPVFDVLIISDTQTISNKTIDTDVYITSTGVATFNNVTVNGNIYCYGQLKASGSKAENVFAYAYGSMMSCGAFDGTHGKVSGGISCNKLTILDNALDYAFNKWGKR